MFKRCPKWGQTKELEEFCRNGQAKDGRANYYKPCHNANTRAKIRRLYGNTRHYHLKQRFGIGAADVDRMIEEQGGLCACCHEAPAAHVDHDHVREGSAESSASTATAASDARRRPSGDSERDSLGKVRGMLCFSCNGAIGQFEECPDKLRRALAYLAAFQGDNESNN